MKLHFYSLSNFKTLPQIKYLSEEEQFNIQVVGTVLPFRTNNYVTEELINWDNYKEDPLYNLTFPHKEMLSEEQFNRIASLIKDEADAEELTRVVSEIRLELNPHPAGQLEKNVPVVDGQKVMGIQHKYAETALYFPSAGQTCHAFCSFCFRWPQFASGETDKFGMSDTSMLIRYLQENPSITDLLITGGDPMIMSSRKIEEMLTSIMDADIPNLRNIRIGTKTLSFWPYRYVTDKDSEQLLDTFKRVVDSGLHLSVMAHLSHPVELKTDIVKQAIKNIQSTGAVIRAQSPLLNHINASAEVWRELWREEMSLGIIPYYMFVARPTGGYRFFSVSLVKAYTIFKQAYSHVSGLGRTVRGPSMSASWGKITVNGIAEINDKEVMVLEFVQSRDASQVKKLFIAEYNSEACWIDDLKPADGEEKFFFQ